MEVQSIHAGHPSLWNIPWGDSTSRLTCPLSRLNNGSERSVNQVFNLDGQCRVYLGAEPIDFRKQIDGIALQVQEALEMDPYSPCVFVFRNRACDKLKLLYWHHNGFVLVYKRLEKGQFKWPLTQGRTSVPMSMRELTYLIEGGDITDLNDINVLHYNRV